MRLVLIRHGRTRANDESLYCGSTDLPLSERGRRALEELRREGGYPSGDGFRFYTSGMLRTEETLSVLYGQTEHSTLPGFREMDFGSFEMHSYEQLKDDPAYRTWCDGDNESNIAPGGESGRIMTARVLDTLEQLINCGEDAVVITHGGPIAAVMTALFPEEGKNLYEWQPVNGKGYVIRIGTDRSWAPIPGEGDA